MEPTERLDLRWNSFETNTRVTFKKLRGESEFSDVTLVCNGGRQVSAHKVILAGGSTFFQQILRQNPHPHPLVYLKGVRYEDLLTILDFVYIGEATIVQEELNSFLEVAEDLQIKGLVENLPLLQKKTSAGINNKASQSPYQENQENTPLSNIKIDPTDTVHSDVSFGMDSGEEMTDSEKKEMTYKNNLHQNQMPVDVNIKIEKDDVSNFNFEGDNHIESDKLAREFNDGYNMSVTELAGNISNDEVEAHYWYEEGGEYGSAGEATGIASIDEEVSKATSMEHNLKLGQNRDEVISLNKNGRNVCTVCGKSFGYDSQLKQHMTKHTGEKPFLCLYCPKKFTRSSNLKVHTKVYHEN